MTTSATLPPPEAFIEVPGMRGLRIAELGSSEGKSLQVLEAVKGVIIPRMVSESIERVRVLEGRVQFHDGRGACVLGPGDVREVPAGEAHGPHIFLEPSRLAILRDDAAAAGAP